MGLLQTIKGLFGLYKDFADAKTWLGKRWFLSKTLWVNALAIICAFIAAKYQMSISAEEQLGILAVVNMVLRLVTKQPLVTKEDNIIDLRPVLPGGAPLPITPRYANRMTGGDPSGTSGR